MQLFCTVGRTERLALAELQAVFGDMPQPWAISILPVGMVLLNPSKGGVSLDMEGLAWLSRLQYRLGGTTRIGVVVSSGSNLHDLLLEQLQALAHPGSKLVFALRSPDGGRQSMQLGLQLKRELQALGVSVRYVRNQENDTSTVQTWHEKLDVARHQEGMESTKAELWYWKDKSQWVVGRTLTVQNIEDYSHRDFGIPFPNAYNGMVPPKLAQMLVNVGVGYGTDGVAVYDPFCGSGRIVSEAWLMGLTAWGSDKNRKIVEDTQQNLEWIYTNYPIFENQGAWVWYQDALDVQENEQLRSQIEQHPDVAWYVISEPYLGKPLKNPLKPQEADGWLADVLPLYEGFLKAWTKENMQAAGITNLPKSFALVFPRATVEGRNAYRSVYESLVDRFPSLGYSCIQLFRYGRPSALIQREIVLFTYDGN